MEREPGCYLDIIDAVHAIARREYVWPDNAEWDEHDIAVLSDIPPAVIAPFNDNR